MIYYMQYQCNLCNIVIFIFIHNNASGFSDVVNCHINLYFKFHAKSLIHEVDCMLLLSGNGMNVLEKMSGEFT